MLKKIGSAILIAIVLCTSCSSDDIISPTESYILGTWYCIEVESTELTFFPDNCCMIVSKNTVKHTGTYSYIESERKGLLIISGYSGAHFTITSGILKCSWSHNYHINGKTYHK